MGRPLSHSKSEINILIEAVCEENKVGLLKMGSEKNNYSI